MSLSAFELTGDPALSGRLGPFRGRSGELERQGYDGSHDDESEKWMMFVEQRQSSTTS